MNIGTRLIIDDAIIMTHELNLEKGVKLSPLICHVGYFRYVKYMHGTATSVNGPNRMALKPSSVISILNFR